MKRIEHSLIINQIFKLLLRAHYPNPENINLSVFILNYEQTEGTIDFAVIFIFHFFFFCFQYTFK